MFVEDELAVSRGVVELLHRQTCDAIVVSLSECNFTTVAEVPSAKSSDVSRRMSDRIYGRELFGREGEK